jgi:hypothetical protein
LEKTLQALRDIERFVFFADPLARDAAAIVTTVTGVDHDGPRLAEGACAEHEKDRYENAETAVPPSRDRRASRTTRYSGAATEEMQKIHLKSSDDILILGRVTRRAIG